MGVSNHFLFFELSFKLDVIPGLKMFCRLGYDLTHIIKSFCTSWQSCTDNENAFCKEHNISGSLFQKQYLHSLNCRLTLVFEKFSFPFTIRQIHKTFYILKALQRIIRVGGLVHCASGGGGAAEPQTFMKRYAFDIS